MKGIFVLTIAIVTALVFASVGYASALTCTHGSTCGAGSPGGPSAGGTLPFTGMNLAGAAGVAGLLLLSGVMLRRVGRRRR